MGMLKKKSYVLNFLKYVPVPKYTKSMFQPGHLYSISTSTSLDKDTKICSVLIIY